MPTRRNEVTRTSYTRSPQGKLNGLLSLLFSSSSSVTSSRCSPFSSCSAFSSSSSSFYSFSYFPSSTLSCSITCIIFHSTYNKHRCYSMLHHLPPSSFFHFVPPLSRLNIHLLLLPVLLLLLL